VSRAAPTPAERSLSSRLAAHESWARTTDPTARTANARKAFLDRFEKQADPNRELSPEERARRAGHLRKAYYTRLALKSVQGRRKAAEARKRVADIEAETISSGVEQAVPEVAS
jgi:hypothetical protein